MAHLASCCCGQLSLIYADEITKTSICHCFECQKRTGSAFGIQTRLDSSKVLIQGNSTVFQRSGDEEGVASFHFCPQCGSTVYWELDVMPGSTVVALGAFADPTLPSPTFMVYGNRKHHWIEMPASAIEYFG